MNVALQCWSCNEGAALSIGGLEGGVSLGVAAAIDEQESAARIIGSVGFTVVNRLAMMHERISRLQQAHKCVRGVKCLRQAHGVSFDPGWLMRAHLAVGAALVKHWAICFGYGIDGDPDGEDIWWRLAEVGVILVSGNA